MQCTEIFARLCNEVTSIIFERALVTLDFERARATHQCGNIIMTALAIVATNYKASIRFLRYPWRCSKVPFHSHDPVRWRVLPSPMMAVVFASTIIYSLSQPASFSRSPITNLWECSTYRRYKVFVWP